MYLYVYYLAFNMENVMQTQVAKSHILSRSIIEKEIT